MRGWRRSTGNGELERIEYELGIIENKGFAPYFLTIDDIVKMSKSVNDDYRTCGRGLGAASIVSYSLGITNVDPLAYNLYFERLLNPARPDPLDIDVDFPWEMSGTV
jgi:DNA polymerase-3 subunit alpha/error-prone DNA polymerase